MLLFEGVFVLERSVARSFAMGFVVVRRLLLAGAMSEANGGKVEFE